MQNPFKALGSPQLEDPKGEEVEGRFDCLHFKCYERAYTAVYLERNKVLTWKCPQGHVSAKEDYELD